MTAIVFCSRAALTYALVQFEPEVVVSLVGPGEIGDLSEPGRTHLHLDFHDVQQSKGHWRGPNQFDITDLLLAVDDWTTTRPLLIHCHGGRSRSAAAAYMAACHAGTDAEDIVATRLMRAAPWCAPHAGMLALADRLLGRQGRMVEALQ